uniref:Uncharacterized protein n=1 Tax=Panagrolaimus sp. ES5 TaxID=591445 RepID=A0AC34FNJ1_9BILA
MDSESESLQLGEDGGSAIFRIFVGGGIDKEVVLEGVVEVDSSNPSIENLDLLFDDDDDVGHVEESIDDDEEDNDKICFDIIFYS